MRAGNKVHKQARFDLLFGSSVGFVAGHGCRLSDGAGLESRPNRGMLPSCRGLVNARKESVGFEGR